MDLQELREKYDRVPDEEQATAAVKTAWEQVGLLEAKLSLLRGLGMECSFYLGVTG